MTQPVRKFVSREFIKTVDLDLLRRLLAPHEASIGLDWSNLPDDESARRDALFELFSIGEGFPTTLQNALHYAKLLAGDAGARILLEQAELSGVELSPRTPEPTNHPDTRSIALLAYLDHPALFQMAVDRTRLWATSRPLERRAARPGIHSREGDMLYREHFREAVRQYFLKKYSGNFCEVRWYYESDEVGILVLHGRNRKTANVEVDGGETTLSFHEIGEDTIRYCADSGLIKIGADSKRDAKKLLELFAVHLLGEPDAFAGATAEDLYSLAPIQSAGSDYVFRTGWDEDVAGVSIVEIQLDEGRGRGRERMLPWGMKLKDNQDALRRAAELLGHGAFIDCQIFSAKLVFHLIGEDGKETTVPVLVQPPDVASFRDHHWEATIFDHLERNGLRRATPRSSTPLAAE